MQQEKYLSHNRLSAFGVIGTYACFEKAKQMIKSHNRLSTFGVIGTRCVSGLSRQLFYKSQSPFGFWGDWNKVQYYAFFKAMESHNRLSAFGVIGTTMNVTLAEDEYKKSQSPFGFWGDWNNIGSDDWTIYYNVTIAFRLLG